MYEVIFSVPVFDFVEDCVCNLLEFFVIFVYQWKSRVFLLLGIVSLFSAAECFFIAKSLTFFYFPILGEVQEVLDKFPLVLTLTMIM